MRRATLSLDAVPERIIDWTKALGLEIEVKAAPSGDEALFPNRLAVSGKDADWLAANKGQALDALQFLVHEVQGGREDDKLAYLDVNGARLFRMKEVVAMAHMAAGKAREMGFYTLGALSPRERRWIHITLEKEGDIGTESEGVGTFKPVKVFKK